MSWNPLYDDVIFGPDFRKIFTTKRKEVKHRELCPICCRANVNIYIEDGTWKCKKCLDKG